MFRGGEMEKKMKSVSPYLGIKKTLDVMRSGSRPFRNNVFRTKENGWIVDTCVAYDTEVWETGIDRTGTEDHWVIVEQYETEEEAQKGHELWVKKLRENPNTKLEDINVWEL